MRRTIRRMTRRLTSATFVGRSTELSRLRAMMEELHSGRHGVALIAGEAGVGKTRLLREFAAEAARERVRVLTGHCLEFGGERLPLAPVAELGRQLARDLPAERLDEILGPARWWFSRLVPEIEAPEDDPHAGAAEAQLALGVFERLAGQGPLLLAFEDLHWADQSTLELFALLARCLDHMPVLIVGTYRSDELPRLHPLRPVLAELQRAVRPERLDLAPFSFGELRELHESISGPRTDDVALEQIWRYSQGNAFFAEELIAHGDVGLPATLRDVIDARVAGLSSDAGAVVRAAAIEPRIEAWLLERVTTLTPEHLEMALEELHDAGILDFDAETYVFRHALTRELVAAGLSPSARSSLHRAYADAIADAQPGRLGDIAGHYWACGAHEQGLRAAVAAGDAAYGVGAANEALLQYERSLDLWERVSDPAAVAGQLKHRLLGRASAAALDARAFSEAERLAQDAIAEAEAERPTDAVALWRQLSFTRFTVNSPGVTEAAERAVQLMTPETHQTMRVQTLASLVMASAVADHERAEEVALEPKQLAEASNDDMQRAWAGLAMGHAIAARGDRVAPSEMQGALRAALRTRHGGTIALCYRWVAWCLVAFGRYRECVAVAAEGVPFTRSAGQFGANGVAIELNAASALMRLGEWEEAAARTRRLLRGLRFAEEWADGICLAWGQLLVRTGDLEGARRWLKPARALVMQPLLAANRGHVMAAIVELEAADQLHAQAVATVQEVIEAAGTHHLGHEAEVVCSALATVELDLETVDRWLAWIDTRRGQSDEDPTHQDRWLWLLLAEAEGERLHERHDPDRWAAIAAACDEEERAYPAAYARFRAAEALLLGGSERPGGHHPRASALAADAFKTAVRLGAVRLQSQLRQLARVGRLALEEPQPRHAPSRRPAVAGIGELTARQLEVLELLARGQSNGEIGRALFISAKTASVHVSNIMRKLEANSRVEAAVIAQRRGLLREGEP